MLKNLKTIRESKGLSQKDLGTMIGVEQQTISGYESISDPSSEILCKLADCLQTNADYLLGRTESEAETGAFHEYELSTTENLIVQEYRDQDALGKELIENTLKTLHLMSKTK